jgi:hypothetical protein
MNSLKLAGSYIWMEHKEEQGMRSLITKSLEYQSLMSFLKATWGH